MTLRNVYFKNCGTEEILNALQQIADDEFASEKYLWPEARKSGFKSNPECVCDKIQKEDNSRRDAGKKCLSVYDICSRFCFYLFSDTKKYEDWEIEVIDIPGRGPAGVSIAWQEKE